MELSNDLRIYSKCFLFILCMSIFFPCYSYGAKRVAVVLSNQHVMYESIYESFRNSPQLKKVTVKKYVLSPSSSNNYIQDAIKGGHFE